MKKLTAGIFATLLAVVSADSAYAAIASKGYVDEQVGAVESTVTELGDTINNAETGLGKQVEDLKTTVAGKADSSTVTALDGRVDAAEGEIDALQTEVGGKQDALGFTPENSANKTTTLSGTSTDVQYPSAKAVWDTIQTETTGIASDADVTALEGRVGTLETASKTHATKTELSEGLAAKANTADLGTLATLNAVSSAQITDGAVATADIADKAVTEAKLSDTVNASLDKADTALQAADLADYVTKEAADAAYADIATETTASTASTNAQTALSNIGTLSQLTTDAKTNTVAAINEVATEAAAAASAASAADGKAVAAQGAAETAQGAAEAAQADVDALETTVSGQGTRLTAAEGEIDDIQAEMDTMATSETVTNLTGRVTAAEGDIDDLEAAVNNAESGLAATNTIADSALSTAQSAQTTANAALPKATYDSQVGTVSATNMGTTASTVVTAINEVAGEAAAAQQKANAAIPAPSDACADPDNKCVLVSAGAGNYSWEVIARGNAE